jgi:EAL domain-containing protein (putative c-di-GMP-specific phosphodiesterase class I)
VEALARWNREDGESWLGAALLPMGTDVTLAAKLWAWALRTVCLDAKAWRTSGHMPPRIVLAVPPALVSQRELAIGIQRRLSETELEPSMLEITIDESTIAVDWDLASRVLERWAATGLSLAIGGIGTGPASLEALRRLPVRTLQFAPDFVRKLEPDSPDLALVSGIIAMARRLDWCVVGTGVETGEQEALLRTEGCDVMQGPWFAPPAAPDEIAAVLRVRGTT